MSRRLPRGVLVAVCAVIVAAPASFVLAENYRKDAQGRVLHHHTGSYTIYNGVGTSDTQLRDQINQARINWRDGLAGRQVAGESAVTVPSTSAKSSSHIDFERAPLGESGARVAWMSGWHDSHTVATFNSYYSNNMSGAEKQGRACNTIGNILGLADAGSGRGDCIGDATAYTLVGNTSLDLVDDYYGPNLFVTGTMFEQRDDLKETRSYSLTATGSGHAMKSLKLFLDGSQTPVMQDDRPPCTDKCDRSVTFTREGSALGDGEHSLRVVAENEFGQTTEKTYTLFVETHTGIMRHYTFEDQQLRDRSSLHVNVANGNLVLEENDLGIPGTGLALRVDRYWNSLTSRSTDLGNGWSMGTAEGVKLAEFSSGDVRFHGPSGFAARFKKQTCNGCSGYDPPRGLDATLTKRTSGVPSDETFKLELAQSEEKYFFSPEGRFEKHQDKNGHTLDFVYDAPGDRLLKITDTQSRDLNFASFTAADTSDPDIIGKIKSMTDLTGRTWRYTYDDRGNLTSMDPPDPANPASPTPPVIYSYDSQNRLTTIQDPEGNYTAIAYDASTRRVKSVTRDAPPGGIGFTTDFAYDQHDGDCTDDGSNDDDESTYVTDPIGHNTTADPTDHRTLYCSDGESQVNETRDALGHRQERGYTSAGNVETYSSPEGLQYDFTYDGSDRLTRAEGPGGSLSTLEYQGSTFRVSATHEGTTANPNRVNYFFAYDAAGNMTSVSDNAGQTNPLVQLEYRDDPAQPILKGTLKSSTDGRGKKTLYDVDAKGNIIRETPPKSVSNTALQGDTVYAYDQLSRLNRVTDPNGVKRAITYDPLDRTVLVDYGTFDPSLNSPVIDDSIRYEYDFNGNLTARVDGRKNQGRDDQRDEYRYNGRNLRDLDILRMDRSVAYTYDAAGNLTSIEDLAGLNSYGTTNYTYNEVNQVKTITEPGLSCPTQCFTYTYNKDNLPTQIVLPNGLTVTNSYGETANNPGTGRLTETKVSAGATVLSDLQYRWDQDRAGPQDKTASDLTNLRWQAKDTVQNITTNYDYDSFNRLTSATETGTAPGLHSYGYAYDRAFNLTQATTDGQSINYLYNNVNELILRGLKAFTYDNAGNLCGEGSGEVATCNPASQSGQRYTYNNRNQTGSITPSGGTAIPFDYAGESQTERLLKGQIEYTDNILGLGLEDPPGSGGLADPTFFTRNPDTGEALGMRTPQTPQGRYYYMTDGLGTVIGLTSQSGSLVTSYRYEPYGKAVGIPLGPTNPIRFQNQYLDAETGLYKMGQRYYDPGAQRWTQKDPLNLFQDPRQGNRYAFVGANPVNQSDPTGALFGIDVDVSIGFEDALAVFETSQLFLYSTALTLGGIYVGGACTAATAGFGVVACAGVGAAITGTGLAGYYATYRYAGEKF
jgi:RHS repeat-associated protein